MKIRSFIYITFLIIILFAACSGVPTSKYEVEVRWDQNYLGNDGGVLHYKVKVDNFLPIPTGGIVYLKITCYDGATFKEEVKFNIISGLSSAAEKESKHVDGKRVTKVEVTDDEFYSR
jgi:hypothetical protein